MGRSKDLWLEAAQYSEDLGYEGSKFFRGVDEYLGITWIRSRTVSVPIDWSKVKGSKPGQEDPPEAVQKLAEAAVDKGYRLDRRNDWSLVFKKGDLTFNLYWKKQAGLYSVQTALNHPKKEKRQQLNRKNIGSELVLQLLDYPRLHTGKGYYKK